MDSVSQLHHSLVIVLQASYYRLPQCVQLKNGSISDTAEAMRNKLCKKQENKLLSIARAQDKAWHILKVLYI